MSRGSPGRLNKVVIAGALIAGLDKHEFNVDKKELDDSEYGLDWEKVLGGSLSAKGSVSGKMREGDAGQAALKQYQLSPYLCQDLKLYFSPTLYWEPDLTTDPEAGALIKSLKIGSSFQGMTTVAMDFTTSGAWHEVSS